jgi:CheY-like chemotaxis protein
MTSPTTAQRETGEAKPARQVLIVDDVLINRKLAVAIFRRMGWQSADVDSAPAALDWLAANRAVDLILLDISMPEMNGEELCQKLRADPFFSRLPIVAYTAHAMQVDIDRFLANGFNDALIKPISVQDITDLVARLFPE